MIYDLRVLLKLMCFAIGFSRSSGEYDYYESGRVVILNPRLLTWAKAVAECEEKNGTLLTVLDISTMHDVGMVEGWSVWVGLKLTGDLSSMAWYSGAPVTWTNWDIIPNPTGSIGQCVFLETSMPFGWTATSCTTKLASLCEVKTENPCHFIVEKRSSLIGYTSSYFIDIDLDSCRNACISTNDFKCLSFEYNEMRELCQLAQVNKWMHQRQFTRADPEWDYYHLDCYTSDVNINITQPTPSPSEMTTSSRTEATTEKFCFSLQDLSPSENATRQIQSIIQELQNLQVKYKNRRLALKKESVSDPRPSATYMGGVAIVIVSTLFGLIVLLDVMTFARNCCHGDKKKKMKKLENLHDKQLKEAGRSILAQRQLKLSIKHLAFGTKNIYNVVNGNLSPEENEGYDSLSSSAFVDNQQSSDSSPNNSDITNNVLDINCVINENFEHEKGVESDYDLSPTKTMVDTNSIHSRLFKYGDDFDDEMNLERVIVVDDDQNDLTRSPHCYHRRHNQSSSKSTMPVYSINGTGRLNSFPSTWHQTTMAGSSYTMLPFMGKCRRNQSDVDVTPIARVMGMSFRNLTDD